MGAGKRDEKPENGTWRIEERKRWWNQGARKGKMRELEAPSAEAGARTGGPLLCSSPPRCCRDCAPCFSVAWPWRSQAGPGRCARRPAEAQVHSPATRPARAAPPSHPDPDVKGPATESGTRSPRFLGNGDGLETSSCALTSLRHGPRVPGGWGRGSANPRGE